MLKLPFEKVPAMKPILNCSWLSIQSCPRLAKLLAAALLVVGGTASRVLADYDSADPHGTTEQWVKVAQVSFTGNGTDGVKLEGVVSQDHWHDTNGNNKWDYGELAGASVIHAPEYVAQSGRDKHAYFVMGTRFHVKAQFIIENVGMISSNPGAVQALATCGDWRLNLGPAPLHKIDGNLWEGTMQIAAPIDDISAFDNLEWHWSIVVNGMSWQDLSQHSIFVLGGNVSIAPRLFSENRTFDEKVETALLGWQESSSYSSYALPLLKRPASQLATSFMSRYTGMDNASTLRPETFSISTPPTDSTGDAMTQKLTTFTGIKDWVTATNGTAVASRSLINNYVPANSMRNRWRERVISG